MSKLAAVTTRELEMLVAAVNRLYATRSRLTPGNRGFWRAWRSDLIDRLHGVMKPAARPYAGKSLAAVTDRLLDDLESAWSRADELDATCDELSQDYWNLWAQHRTLERTHEEAGRQVEALTRELARRPVAAALVLPAQKIAVESEIQRAVLRLVAAEGLGRVWRIVARVQAEGMTGNANTVRNGIARLVERGLLADYEQHGEPVGWAYKAGGTRRLVQLTPTGRQWCQATLGCEPVESEIALAARRHKSVSHGVAILEAAHHLSAAGYAVDLAPEALLADAAAPWRARAEPDLAFTLQAQRWPVEIQREVSERVLAKWIKSLDLVGRLALVLYHEAARKKQTVILLAERFRLPPGVVWLVSLERMEAGAWRWEELVIPSR